MKKVKFLKEMNYQGIDVVPGNIMYLPDLNALSLKYSGDVEILLLPENRQTK